MNLEEYKSNIYELEKKHKLELNALHIEYAKANNPYKIGDIIQDHYCKIEIESIKVTINAYRHPYCFYTGIKLNKDNTKNKLGKKETIHQTNIIEL